MTTNRMGLEQTLSDERLEEIAELARKATYKPCFTHQTNLIQRCDSEAIEEMARETLARRKASKEPIYQLRDWHWYDSEKHIYEEVTSDGGEGRIVYVSPPLPAVTVPDVTPYLHGLWPNAVDSLMRYADACRAAMLKGNKNV
jgi:hypothetical protein